MEPRPDFHPVYVSGQYLTSEHLNETHNFLWQEEKATRYMLAGNGIVQGLQPDFTGGTLLQTVTLKTGAAGTVDGYLVQSRDVTFNSGFAITMSSFTTTGNARQLMEKTEFEKIKESLSLSGEPVELEAIELFADSVSTEDLPDGAKAIQDFAVTAAQAQERVLVAWVAINDAENNHCQQGDCNTKGIQRNYKVRFFLVKSEDLPVLNTASAEMVLCAVSRIRNLSEAGSTAGLHQKSFTAWNNSSNELLPYFSTTAPAKQLTNIAALLSEADKTALTAAATKFNQINASATSANCSQYYNAFAADLCRAINELVIGYNDYAKKYPTVKGERMERTVVIGGLRSTGVDKWRYYFIPATEQVQFEFDRKRLAMLFRRVIALVNGFILQAAIAERSATVTGRPLAIPTVTGDILLQNCAIPYYFDVTAQGAENEVLKYWNPHGGNLRNIFCYYDSKIAGRGDMSTRMPDTDWTHYNFFRIEGHIGMAKQAAISAITNLIVSQGLPVQLLECDINYKGPKKWFDWYDDFVLNLDKWVVTLRKDYTSYDFGPIKNIQTRIKQTSYRNINEVTKIANDFYAYSNVLYNPPKATVARATATGAAAATTAKAIPVDAYDRFQNLVKKDEVTTVYNKFKEAITEQKDLQSQKLVTLKDLTDIEYLGGAPRGGTFVLLHNGTTVIGDGCLAYYYRINQVRMYSV